MVTDGETVDSAKEAVTVSSQLRPEAIQHRLWAGGSCGPFSWRLPTRKVIYRYRSRSLDGDPTQPRLCLQELTERAPNLSSSPSVRRLN